MGYEIRQSETFKCWLTDLRDRRAKTKVLARLELVELGSFGDTKTVGKGVSEIRINHGPGYRVYYTIRQQSVVILLAGGDKMSQNGDIARAQQMAKEV